MALLFLAGALALSPLEREDAYLAIPSNASARASLHVLTSSAHVAGTPSDRNTAEYIRDRFTEAGLSNVHIESPRVRLAYPVDRSLALLNAAGTEVYRAELAEHVLAADPTSDDWHRNHTWLAYAASGNVTARMVYANFGLPEDFDALAAANVSVVGAIAIMRYGRCFRKREGASNARAFTAHV